MADLRIALTTTLNERAIAPLNRMVDAAGRGLTGLNRNLTDVTQTGKKLDTQLTDVAQTAKKLDTQLGGMSGPAQAARQVTELAQRTQQAIGLTQRLESAWNATGGIIRSVGAVAAGYQVGKAIMKGPLDNAKSYEFALANAANTAYSDRTTIEGRRAGMGEMDRAVRRAAVEGVSRGDALIGLKTMIAGGTDRSSAMTMLPTVAKFAFAGDASVEDVAQLAIKAQKNGGIKAERMPQALEMALVAGQLGNFEFKDMARWLPQQLATANQMLGMSGEKDFSQLLAINQMAGNVAGSSNEAGNNVINFLGKVNSQDTANDAKKLGIDLAGSLAAAREKGTSPPLAFINLLRDTANKNPAYVKLQKRLEAARASGASEEQVQTLEAMTSLMKGEAIGKLVQDRQALGGMLGIINDPKGFAKLVTDIRTRQGESELSQGLLKTTAHYGDQQLENAQLAAQYDGLSGVNSALGEMKVELSSLMSKYPEQAAVMETGRVTMMALTAAAGTAAVSLGLLSGVSGGGAVAAMGSRLIAPVLAGLGGVAAVFGGPAVAAAAIGIPLLTAFMLRDKGDGAATSAASSTKSRAIALADQINQIHAQGGSAQELARLERERAESIKEQGRERADMARKIDDLAKAILDRPVEVHIDGQVVQSSVNWRNIRDGRRE